MDFTHFYEARQSCEEGKRLDRMEQYAVKHMGKEKSSRSLKQLVKDYNINFDTKGYNNV